MPTQQQELLNCPFCGSPASEDGNNLIGILISCSNAKCPVSPDVSGKNRAYAYPAWNTRAEDADHIQRVAALQATLRKCEIAFAALYPSTLIIGRNEEHETEEIAVAALLIEIRAALKEAHEDTEG